MAEKIRQILIDMIVRQYKQDTGIDNRINLYLVEVQFVKDVIVALAGDSNMDNEKLHDWACDLVDEIHKEFGK